MRGRRSRRAIAARCAGVEVFFVCLLSLLVASASASPPVADEPGRQPRRGVVPSSAPHPTPTISRKSPRRRGWASGKAPSRSRAAISKAIPKEASSPPAREHRGERAGVFRFDALRIEGLAGPNALVLRRLLRGRRRTLVRLRRSFVHRIVATFEASSP